MSAGDPLAAFDVAYRQRTEEEAKSREVEELSKAEHLDKLRSIAVMARGKGWEVFQEWITQQAQSTMEALMAEKNPHEAAKMTGRLHVLMTVRTWAEANLKEYKVVD